MLKLSGLATTVTFATADHHDLPAARRMWVPSMVHVAPAIRAACAEQPSLQ
jgi:hypothetical protein